MAQFLAVSNRKGGVGKSTIAVMLAHAAAAWGGRRVLVMDLDTQCNASLMLIGGEGWDKAARAGHTIADYFYDRFDKVAEDESAYVVGNVGDIAHARAAPGRVSLLPGSQRLEDIQGELYLKVSKKDLDADAVSVQVRSRMKRLMKHFGMDFDLVILDCPPGLSFAALAALDLADRVIVPFRPDFVSQFALDRVALMIEKVETGEQLADIPFEQRRYACLANTLRGEGAERMLLDQLALDHPLLDARMPLLDSIARAFDWDETKKNMEEKYADALPHLRALHDEVFGAPALRARTAQA
ncbi:MAG: ParA family protein [Hyphomicrobiaceae bacterium]|nr:MAG: ParA family protein [Hyphomicrobiaceae bacterium]